MYTVGEWLYSSKCTTSRTDKASELCKLYIQINKLFPKSHEEINSVFVPLHALKFTYKHVFHLC